MRCLFLRRWRGSGRGFALPVAIHRHAGDQIPGVKIRIRFLEQQHLLVQLIPQDAFHAFHAARQGLRFSGTLGNRCARAGLAGMKRRDQIVQGRQVRLHEVVIRQRREVAGRQPGNAFAGFLQRVRIQAIQLPQREFRLAREHRIVALGPEGPQGAGNTHDFLLQIMPVQGFLVLRADDGRLLILRCLVHEAQTGVQLRHGVNDRFRAVPNRSVLVHIGSHRGPHSGSV